MLCKNLEFFCLTRYSDDMSEVRCTTVHIRFSQCFSCSEGCYCKILKICCSQYFDKVVGVCVCVHDFLYVCLFVCLPVTLLSLMHFRKRRRSNRGNRKVLQPRTRPISVKLAPTTCEYGGKSSCSGNVIEVIPGCLENVKTRLLL